MPAKQSSTNAVTYVLISPHQTYSMAADALPTAYKEASSLIEWESLPEEDQMKQQEEMAKFLQEPGTIEKFIEACKNIGRTAAAIEGDSKTVKNGLGDLHMKYDHYFPDVREVYIPRWEVLMARWIEKLGSSKRLAIETALALTNYGAILMRIADNQTQSVLEGAQSALRAYVEKYPIDIATEVADGFKNLRIDIQDFSDDFAKYVGNFCSSNNAVSLEASIKAIKQCQETISDLNEKIQKSAMALGCSSVFGILADIPVGTIGHYVVQRNEAQANLNKTKSGITGWSEIIRYLALLAMQADFEKFKPNIVDICQELSSFANIWAFATLQSIELNVALEEGMVVLTRKKFQMKLALLIIQIEPLKEGLRAYAAQI